MSSRDERIQVLRMIEQGDISPEEGALLLQALEGKLAISAVEPVEPSPEINSPSLDHQPIEPEAQHWKSWWLFPLWFGVGITIIGALLAYTALVSTGMGFWFYCAWLPFIIGLGIIILAWYSRTSRWLHIRIWNKKDRKHNAISLSFPLPLGIAAWFLRNFGHWIPQLRGTQVDELILALQESATPDTPFIVQVDDDNGSEHIEVFIG
jgi:hypothetical protein